MPKLSQEVVATTEHTVELNTRQRVCLTTRLKVYAEQKVIRDAADEKMKAARVDLEELLYEVGEERLDATGLGKVKIVAPVKKKLDMLDFAKRLLKAGVPLAKFNKAKEEATKDNPTKPYAKITLPGEKDHGGDE